jgi:hypothetical protein
MKEGRIKEDKGYHGIDVHGEIKICAACALHKARARVVSKVTETPAVRPGEKFFMDM